MITTVFRAFLAAPMAFSSSNLPYAWNVEAQRRWWKEKKRQVQEYLMCSKVGGVSNGGFFVIFRDFSTFRYMFGRPVALSWVSGNGGFMIRPFSTMTNHLFLWINPSFNGHVQ